MVWQAFDINHILFYLYGHDFESKIVVIKNLTSACYFQITREIILLLVNNIKGNGLYTV